MKYTIKINATVNQTIGYSETELHETEIELKFPETGVKQLLDSDQIGDLVALVYPSIRKALEAIEDKKTAVSPAVTSGCCQSETREAAARAL